MQCQIARFSVFFSAVSGRMFTNLPPNTHNNMPCFRDIQGNSYVPPGFPNSHARKFQDTERFLISCPRHASSQLTTPSSCHGAYYPNKLGDILYLLICSFLLCLSWLLCCRIRKFRRDIWNTLFLLRYLIFYHIRFVMFPQNPSENTEVSKSRAT
jgi:hypothetical protein